MQTTLSPDVYVPFKTLSCLCSLLLFSRSAVSNSLRPHGLQHTRLPHPSPSPVLKRLFLQKCRLSLESIFFVLLTSAFPCWRNRKYMVCSELDTSSAWRNTHMLSALMKPMVPEDGETWNKSLSVSLGKPWCIWRVDLTQSQDRWPGRHPGAMGLRWDQKDDLKGTEIKEVGRKR